MTVGSVNSVTNTGYRLDLKTEAAMRGCAIRPATTRGQLRRSRPRQIYPVRLARAVTRLPSFERMRVPGMAVPWHTRLDQCYPTADYVHAYIAATARSAEDAERKGSEALSRGSP